MHAFVDAIIDPWGRTHYKYLIVCLVLFMHAFVDAIIDPWGRTHYKLCSGDNLMLATI